MRPAGLVAVCNEVVHGARTRIVECGSGVSTVVLARLLRERGPGRLVALEHDGHWAALVHEQLRREALDRIARVIHAPLEGEPPWYALARLLERCPTSRPARRRRTARVRDRTRDRRAPRCRAPGARLVAGADGRARRHARPGEREVLARWEASTDWRFALDEPPAWPSAPAPRCRDPGRFRFPSTTTKALTLASSSPGGRARPVLSGARGRAGLGSRVAALHVSGAWSRSRARGATPSGSHRRLEDRVHGLPAGGVVVPDTRL